jgi:hypothetical protein
MNTVERRREMKIMVGAVMVVALLVAFSLGFYVKSQTPVDVEAQQRSPVPAQTPINVDHWLPVEPKPEPGPTPINLDDLLIDEPTPAPESGYVPGPPPVLPGSAWSDEAGQEWREEAQQVIQRESDRRERERADREVQELNRRIDCLEGKAETEDDQFVSLAPGC